MPQAKNAKQSKDTATQTNPFQLRNPKDTLLMTKSQVHIFGNGVICDTDTRGYAPPKNQDPGALVIDVSEGFIPLWARDSTLEMAI